MKNILKFAVCLLLTTSAYAQKFGHVNSNDLLLAMPDRKQAETTLQDYAKQLEGQLKTMSAEYDSKVQDYQSKQNMMTDVIKQDKAREIQGLEERIKAFQETAQESLQKKESELMTPMINKAKKAIEDVAKENNYRYIFDSSLGVLLYLEPSDDVMALVKKKMGLTDAPANNTAPKK